MYITNFQLEEFDKSSHEPYIPRRSDTNLLNLFMAFPEEKNEVTVKIINSLYSAQSKDFSSAFHISWAMEFLGFAFSLPLKHHKVISKSFKLYRKWILDSDRPVLISQNEDFYQQEIICHLSLLFTERGGSIEIHSKLCKKVLIFFKELTEKKNLTRPTWHTLLKVLLLISNFTLTNMKTLSQHISPFLLTVLFELLIKSNTRDKVLWKELELSSALWLDHIWLFNQWQSVILELTRKVVEFLFAEFNPTSVFRSSVLEESKLLKPGENFTLEVEIESETALFLWHKFLSLMLNNTKDKVPDDCKVHRELSESIERVVDIFLEVCEKRNNAVQACFFKDGINSQLAPLVEEINRISQEYVDGKSRLPIPSGNSLLNIFGDWLFFHSEVKELYSEFGKGPALGTLCKIVCKAQGPIDDKYLSKFSTIMHNQFSSTFDEHTVGYMIKNSQNLFSLNYTDIRQFAFSDQLLNCIKRIVSDPENHNGLKKHCCGIICSFVGMSPLLGSAVSSQILKETFIIMLKQDNEPQIFKKIVWSMALLAATEKEENSVHLAEVLVCKLQEINYITQRQNYNLLIECVNSLPYIVDNLSNSKVLIEKLCSYLKKVQTKNVHDTHNLLLLCIFSWWACYPINFDSKSLRDEVISLLESEFINKSVKESAEFVKEFIKQSLLQSFRYSYTKISCDIINTKNTFNQIKHFLYKKQNIISIYSSSVSDSISDQIFCILRNSSGKFVWSANLEYSKGSIKPIELLLETVKNPSEFESIHEENIDIPDDEAYDKYTKLFEEQEDYVIRFSKDFKAEYNENIDLNFQRVDDNKSYRFILSQLGLFNDSQLKELTVIDNEMTGLISQLDDIMEKTVVFIPVFYLDNSESKVNTSGVYSAEYIEFLNHIGLVLTEQHRHIEIFTKINSYISKYKIIIYTSDALNEVIYLPVGISSLSKQEALELSDVFLVWNERNNDKYSYKIPTELFDSSFTNASVFLLIPDNFNCVKVRIIGSSLQGPLLDEMNVSISILPKLLIRTVLNRNLTLSLKVKYRELRRDLITSISEKLKSQSDLVKKQRVLTHSFTP